MFVDRATAALLEAAPAYRAANYARAVRPQPGAPSPAVIAIGGAQVVYAAPDRPVNRAIGLGMTGPVDEADLIAIEAFYRERRADPAIDLCPLADPTLFNLLAARGYRPHAAMTMLVLPLPHSMTSMAAPNTIRVTRAQPCEFDRWIDLSARGFGSGESADPNLLALLAPNAAAEGATPYFAWLEETPIATGGLYQHGPVVELGGTSTLPAYRRRGAQTALIARRLADATAAGCRYATVLTTPGSDSQRNLQQRGFSVAYTRLICVRPTNNNER